MALATCVSLGIPKAIFEFRFPKKKPKESEERLRSFHGAWYTYYRDSIPYSYLYTRGFFKNIDCFKIAALLLLNLVQ